MIEIVRYAIEQRTLDVHVEYEYTITDEVMNEEIVRRSSIVLSQTVAPLDAPDWGDGDLCAALATAINQPIGSVVMAS